MYEYREQLDASGTVPEEVTQITRGLCLTVDTKRITDVVNNNFYFI